MSIFALLPMEITAPTIEYGLLAPVLIIFAGACLGVLAEAVVPRELRRAVQLVVTFGSLGLALATTLLNWASGDEAVVAVDSLAIDGPTYFMWTIVIVFSAASLLMFAETKIENASVFAPQAAAVPGTPAEREAIRSRVEHTEVFPLALFAVLGMMLFPASNDLITMFVVIGDLVVAALSAVRARSATPAAVAGGCTQVLPAGSTVVGLLHLRSRLALWLFRLVHLVGDRRRDP